MILKENEEIDEQILSKLSLLAGVAFAEKFYRLDSEVRDDIITFLKGGKITAEIKKAIPKEGLSFLNDIELEYVGLNIPTILRFASISEEKKTPKKVKDTTEAYKFKMSNFEQHESFDETVIWNKPSDKILSKEIGTVGLKKVFDTKLDAKNRLTIRGAKHKYYCVEIYEDGRVVLNPRILVSEDEISKNTLRMMDETVNNYKSGITSEPIDLKDIDIDTGVDINDEI